MSDDGSHDHEAVGASAWPPIVVETVAEFVEADDMLIMRRVCRDWHFAACASIVHRGGLVKQRALLCTRDPLRKGSRITGAPPKLLVVSAGPAAELLHEPLETVQFALPMEIKLGNGRLIARLLSSLQATHGEHVTTLRLAVHGLAPGCEALRRMAGFPALEHLDLSYNDSLTNEDLAAIVEGAPAIKNLSLRRCRGVTEDGIQHVAMVAPTIEVLDLGLTKLSTAILAAQNVVFSNLRELHMPSKPDSMHKSSDWITWMGQQGELRAVTFKEVAIDNGDIESLFTSAPLVHALTLQATHVNDAGFSDAMPSISPTLRRLEIVDHKHATVNGLCRALSQVPDERRPPIQHLNFSGCDIGPCLVANDASLAARLPRGLLTLNLAGCEVGPPATRFRRAEMLLAPVVEQQTNLVELNLSRWPISFSLLQGMAMLRNLQRLDLRAARFEGGMRSLDFTGDAASLPFGDLTSLRSLVLDNSYGIRDASLAEIGKLGATLEELSLCGLGHTTDEGIRALVGGLGRLRTLEITNLSKITDTGLGHLGESAAAATLESLDVSSCFLLTTAGALPAVAMMRRLQLFKRYGCSEIPAEGVLAIRRAMPGLVVE